jgi:hypothetical protein
VCLQRRHELPTSAGAVKVVLRGIRRTIGAAKQGKAPATADLIGQMLALCSDSMIGKRDRALLAFGFAGAFRRSELCALDVADLTEVPDGLRILIRRSKGDQEGQGQEVAIPRGYRLRPVEAVQTWLAAAEISSGPVFREVALGGKVSDAALADNSAARIAKRYARRVGLDQRPMPATACAAASSPVRRKRAPRSGNCRGQPSQEPRHAARLRQAGRSVPRARGGGVPVTGGVGGDLDPRSLRHPAVLARRRALLARCPKHMAQLLDYTAGLRVQRPDWFMPDFDPAGGGVRSRVLFLFEKPGPKTDRNGGSGLLSVTTIRLQLPRTPSLRAIDCQSTAAYLPRDPMVGRRAEDSPHQVRRTVGDVLRRIPLLAARVWRRVRHALLHVIRA